MLTPDELPAEAHRFPGYDGRPVARLHYARKGLRFADCLQAPLVWWDTFTAAGFTQVLGWISCSTGEFPYTAHLLAESPPAPCK